MVVLCISSISTPLSVCFSNLEVQYNCALKLKQDICTVRKRLEELHQTFDSRPIVVVTEKVGIHICEMLCSFPRLCAQPQFSWLWMMIAYCYDNRLLPLLTIEVLHDWTPLICKSVTVLPWKIRYQKPN